MCEEIPNPAKNVPRVMIYPLLMGLLTAFPFGASLMYSISDIHAVLNTKTGLPLFEIYYQGTGSKAAASVLMAIFAFCFFANLVANGKRHEFWQKTIQLTLNSHDVVSYPLGCFSRWCSALFPHLGAGSPLL